MNLPTTTEELETLFRDHWSGNEKNTKLELAPLFNLAKKSDKIRGCAVGGMQAMLQGITAGGISPEPVLILILMGFRLGCIWSNGGSEVEWKAPELTKEELAQAAYLKWLEQNPTPKEGEPEDGQTQS